MLSINKSQTIFSLLFLFFTNLINANRVLSIDKKIGIPRSSAHQMLKNNHNKKSTAIIKPRDNSDLFEEVLQDNLERECVEEVCNKEEFEEAFSKTIFKNDKEKELARLKQFDYCKYFEEKENEIPCSDDSGDKERSKYTVEGCISLHQSFSCLLSFHFFFHSTHFSLSLYLGRINFQCPYQIAFSFRK